MVNASASVRRDSAQFGQRRYQSVNTIPQRGSRISRFRREVSENGPPIPPVLASLLLVRDEELALDNLLPCIATVLLYGASVVRHNIRKPATW